MNELEYLKDIADSLGWSCLWTFITCLNTCAS